MNEIEESHTRFFTLSSRRRVLRVPAFAPRRGDGRVEKAALVAFRFKLFGNAFLSVSERFQIADDAARNTRFSLFFRIEFPPARPLSVGGIPVEILWPRFGNPIAVNVWNFAVSFRIHDVLINVVSARKNVRHGVHRVDFFSGTAAAPEDAIDA